MTRSVAEMTDPVAQKMSEASASRPDAAKIGTPRKGERYRCERCGMEIQVTADCKCPDPEHVQFVCCGQMMAKV
jgi:hypothetical protein